MPLNEPPNPTPAQSQSQNQGNSSGRMPWQIKFTYAFGIPAVIAMYLVYYQTNRLDANQAEFTKQISQMGQEVRALHDTMIISREDKEALERKYDRLLNMMVRVCATTAETNVDRNACFEFAGTKGTKGEEYGGMRPYTAPNK